jgi:hypothetical protein
LLDSATIGPQYVYSGEDSNAWVHDHAGNLVYTPNSPDCCKETIVPGPNGYFYVGNESGTVGVYRTSDGSRASTVDMLGLGSGFGMSSLYVDGEYLYVNDNRETYAVSGVTSDPTLETSWPLANGGIDDYDTDSVYADDEYLYFSGDGGNVSVVEKSPTGGTYTNSHTWGEKKRFESVTVNATVGSAVTLTVESDVDNDTVYESSTTVDVRDGEHTYDLSGLANGHRTQVQVGFAGNDSTVHSLQVDAKKPSSGGKTVLNVVPRPYELEIDGDGDGTADTTDLALRVFNRFDAGLIEEPSDGKSITSLEFLVYGSGDEFALGPTVETVGRNDPANFTLSPAHSGPNRERVRFTVAGDELDSGAGVQRADEFRLSVTPEEHGSVFVTVWATFADSPPTHRSVQVDVEGADRVSAAPTGEFDPDSTVDLRAKVADAFARPVNDRTVRFAATGGPDADPGLFAAEVDGERRTGVDAVVVDGSAGEVRFVDYAGGSNATDGNATRTWTRNVTVSGGEYVAADVELTAPGANLSATVTRDGRVRAHLVDVASTTGQPPGDGNVSAGNATDGNTSTGNATDGNVSAGNATDGNAAGDAATETVEGLSPASAATVNRISVFAYSEAVRLVPGESLARVPRGRTVPGAVR